MPTEDAYSSGHLILSHFGTCMSSNIETNLSWTCFVFGFLSFEYPSVLMFCFKREVLTDAAGQQSTLTPPYLVLSNLGLVCLLMLRPVSPELVMFLESKLRKSLDTSILLLNAANAKKLWSNISASYILIIFNIDTCNIWCQYAIS